MPLSEERGDNNWSGTNTFTGALTLTAGTVTNAMVNSAAAIAATKLINRLVYTHAQKTGTVVAAATEEIAIARAGTANTTSTILSFEVTCSTVPTGGDLAFTVDLHRSTAEGAFATVLSAPLTFDSSKVARRVYTATLSATTFIDGDIFRVVVTTSGSTGTQGNGLLCELRLDEQPS